MRVQQLQHSQDVCYCRMSPCVLLAGVLLLVDYEQMQSPTCYPFKYCCAKHKLHNKVYRTYKPSRVSEQLGPCKDAIGEL